MDRVTIPIWRYTHLQEIAIQEIIIIMSGMREAPKTRFKIAAERRNGEVHGVICASPGWSERNGCIVRERRKRNKSSSRAKCQDGKRVALPVHQKGGRHHVGNQRIEKRELDQPAPENRPG